MKQKSIDLRNYNYDLLRIFCCLCVIFIHVADFSYMNNLKEIHLLIALSFNGIVRVGFVIFFILSGALILNSKEEKISKFYFKRFIRIFIPFIIYQILYIIFDPGRVYGNFNITNICIYLKRIIFSENYFHMWFIYIISGIYLVAPYLKKMCKELSQDDMFNLFIVIIFLSFYQYSHIFFYNKDISVKTNLIGFISYFIIGYIITNCKRISDNYKNYYFLGIISFFITILNIKNHVVPLEYSYLFSPFMYFESIALFLFFERINIDKINKNVLINISKYTFDVYLFHPFVYCGFNRLNEIFHFLPYGTLKFFIIYIPFTIIFSFIGSIIIHETFGRLFTKFAYYIDFKTFNFMRK